MNQEHLLRRRDRTRAIVEGALLGDIAIVFLLIRVYLPVLVVRTLIRTLATVPFVMLTQRRGLRMTILAAIASYVLFSALVGPILALTAIDIAIAGILLGIGRKAGLGVGLNTLWTGPVWAILDLVIPTVIGIFVFRVPIKDLEKSAHNFVHVSLNAATWFLGKLGATPSTIHQVKGWEPALSSHWQLTWLGVMVLYGLLNMYLSALVADMVLKQIPEETLSRQKVA
jgi:uncharacterized protein YybS (DUF2232 family)